MSLFEDDNYRWRETYFVLFQHQDRPSATAIQEALRPLAPRVQIREMRAGKNDRLESLTLVSPDDFAAMDLSFVAGEEVIEQVQEFEKQMVKGTLSEDDQKKWERARACDARFDIYHFEQLVANDDDDDEGFLDPGALLIVLQRLAGLCHGVGVDPQSGTLL